MPETFDLPYSATTFDSVGTCDICQAQLVYVATSTKHNPDAPGDINSTLGHVYDWNSRGYHVLPRPDRFADDQIRIQAFAKLFFHKA